MIMKIFSVNPVTGPSLAFAPSFTLSADHSFLFFFQLSVLGETSYPCDGVLMWYMPLLCPSIRHKSVLYQNS